MPEPALAKLSRRGPAGERPRSRKTANVQAAAACSALVLWGSIAGAQVVESAPEHRIEAAYLYNFVAYIDWPPSSLGGEAPIEIGVLGDERVASALVAMTRDRKVRGRSITVRQIQPDDPVAGLHMLFIASESASAITQLREPAREGSVLIVTEWDGALRDGSTINFLLLGDRMRFEVSLDAADASGLSISSRLLSVAERVERVDQRTDPVGLETHCSFCEQALDYVYRRGEFEGRAGIGPRLILLDLKMPKVDGIEVTRALKADEKTRHIPID